MKPKDFHNKKLSLHYQKTLDQRWESPLRTPTTLTSFSFSSQELAPTQPLPVKSPKRTRTPSLCEAEDQKVKDVKSFQEEYLEFGLWPDMSLQSQSELKAKYKTQKIRELVTKCENQRLKAEIKAVMESPCADCEAERDKHNVTKKALEEAVALSSVLLKQVLEMDGKTNKPKSTQKADPSP